MGSMSYWMSPMFNNDSYGGGMSQLMAPLCLPTSLITNNVDICHPSPKTMSPVTKFIMCHCCFVPKNFGAQNRCLISLVETVSNDFQGWCKIFTRNNWWFVSGHSLKLHLKLQTIQDKNFKKYILLFLLTFVYIIIRTISHWFRCTIQQIYWEYWH